MQLLLISQTYLEAFDDDINIESAIVICGMSNYDQTGKYLHYERGESMAAGLKLSMGIEDLKKYARRGIAMSIKQGCSRLFWKIQEWLNCLFTQGVLEKR